MWNSWVAFIKKNTIKTDYLYFIVCIAGIILLAWTLKNCIKAGDEVIAGISAALITLLGVSLTNKNSQLTLDKQLKHQSETFQAQMRDQAEGFKDQMNHQSELLERQMKHQSDENDLGRKLNFKHGQYIELVKCLSATQSYFTKTIFIKFEEFESLDKLSSLKENLNLCKITSSKSISDQLDEIFEEYQTFFVKFSNEAIVLRSLQLNLGNMNKLFEIFGKQTEILSKRFFENVNIVNDLKIINTYKADIIKQIDDINLKTRAEQTRLMVFFKDQIKEINLLTGVIVHLINIELGYISLEEFINEK